MGVSDVAFSHGSYETKFNLGLLPKARSELFFNVFYKLFDVVHADTPALKEEAHRIRYQVFCVENQGFEDPQAHPDGLEKDAYDKNAEQAVLFYKPTGKAIGTVRVILPNQDDWSNSFPLQNLCDSPYLHDELYVKNSCESSRLCISQELREEVKRDVRALGDLLNFDRNKLFSMHEKQLLNIALAAAPWALVRGTFELAMKNNILNVFGVMEPRHLGRLEKAGLIHVPIAQEIEYHGIRRPFVCNVLDVHDHTITHNHDIWNILSVKGENHRRALEVHDRESVMAH